MTSKTRRTEIQIETHEVKVVRFQSQPALALCERCRDIVMALTPEQTAVLLGLTQDEVFRLVDGKRVHLANPERGDVVICGNSFTEDNEFVKQKALTTTF